MLIKILEEDHNKFGKQFLSRGKTKFTNKRIDNREDLIARPMKKRWYQIIQIHLIHMVP